MRLLFHDGDLDVRVLAEVGGRAAVGAGDEFLDDAALVDGAVDDAALVDVEALVLRVVLDVLQELEHLGHRLDGPSGGADVADLVGHLLVVALDRNRLGELEHALAVGLGLLEGHTLDVVAHLAGLLERDRGIALGGDGALVLVEAGDAVTELWH